jgi:hypothetical protein
MHRVLYVIDFLQAISCNSEEFAREELRRDLSKAVWTIEEK